ncbi:MAG: NADH-quinone oxidoreductase subunit N [Verrucomicrobiota bacterium]
MNYLYLLQLLAPESTLVETALVLLILGLFKVTNQRRDLLLGITLIGGVFAAGLLMLFPHPEHVCILNGMVVLDPLTRLFKLAIIVLSLITALFASSSDVREHFAEYLALILFSTVGMMLLVGSEELLMVFIGLELTSISLYVLTAYQQRSAASAEAALKYFLIGGISAAFLLYGLSLIYGVAGTTNLRALAVMPRDVALDPLLLAGIVMALVGFGFKVAAVPFHLWAPDVYEGAPTPSAALIASGSKVAGFFIIAKVLAGGLAGAAGSAAWTHLQPGWLPLLAIMAGISIVLGNLAALVQSNVKRLLAYSAIAHSGYMMLGLTAAGATGVTPVLFYVIVYALTTVGAFGIVSLVEARRGGSQFHHFDGLYKSAPGLALCLLVFLISLAGIPPLAGFFGKFYIFAATLASVTVRANPGMLWLVIVAIALNAVSLYYYLVVLKHVFVAEPSESAANQTRPACAASFAVGVLALAVLLLGLYPNMLLEPIRAAMTSYSATAAR